MSKSSAPTRQSPGPRPESISMALHEFALVFPWLRESDALTVTMSAGDFRRALEMALGGPEVMSTRQAADIYGWNPKRWRGWAEGGRVHDAKQEENGDWRLPRESCRVLVRELMSQGKRPPKAKGVASVRATTQVVRTMTSRKTTTTSNRSIRRGPRKKAA